MRILRGIMLMFMIMFLVVGIIGAVAMQKADDILAEEPEVYFDAPGYCGMKEDVLVSVLGEPDSKDYWDLNGREMETFTYGTHEFTLTSVRFRDMTKGYAVVRVTLYEDIPYKDGEILPLFGLKKKHPIVENPFTYRARDVGVEDFWVYDKDEYHLKGVKITYTDEVF